MCIWSHAASDKTDEHVSMNKYKHIRAREETWAIN